MTGPLGALLGLGIVLCVAAGSSAFALMFASMPPKTRMPVWTPWLMLTAVPGAMLVGYVVGATS